jgi:hypothetical protein
MGQKAMENSSLVSAIEKLAIAGEQAGFTVEQMIQLLNDGLTVETLFDLIFVASPDVEFDDSCLLLTLGHQSPPLSCQLSPDTITRPAFAGRSTNS